MTVCIQCAMRAMVAGQPPPTFDETPEAHAARVHPDPRETQRERQQLEAQLAAMIGTNRTP
jgi:hypothetical protein